MLYRFKAALLECASRLSTQRFPLSFPTPKDFRMAPAFKRPDNHLLPANDAPPDQLPGKT